MVSRWEAAPIHPIATSFGSSREKRRWTVLTQNVDPLHDKAGSKNVLDFQFVICVSVPRFDDGASLSRDSRIASIHWKLRSCGFCWEGPDQSFRSWVSPRPGRSPSTGLLERSVAAGTRWFRSFRLLGLWLRGSKVVTTCFSHRVPKKPGGFLNHLVLCPWGRSGLLSGGAESDDRSDS